MTKSDLYAFKAVFFDIDGTLYPIKHLNKQFRKLYLRHPFRTINFFKARKRVRGEQLKSEKNIITRDEFIEIQARTVNKDRNYFDPIYKDIRKNRKLPPFDGLKDLLLDLKSKGVMLGVLSDFPVETKLDELDLGVYFELKLSSEDCGFLKPDKRAFDYLLAHTNLKASDCLYVGDSVRKDIDGARNAGLSSLLVDELLSIIKQ